ncbi:MAG TPA: asparaginase [Candidatus Copromonas avistercoris]|nr:asparaginase [Candidatus Copromonas avistercoris]
MKHILLLGTGGTIACKRGDNGLTPLLTGDELLSYVPAAREFCHVDAIQVLNIDSTNIHPKHWLMLSQVLEKNYDNYDGFVICHGTDTMAYTAAAMSYLVQHSSKPIVITGAQKPIDLDVTDARTNLLDSLRFASCDRAHGVSIVFDGKVIAGTRGKKERTKSYNAFSSINFPYLAVIQEEHILFYIDDKWQDKETVRFYHDLDSRVALLKLIPSMGSSVLDYLAEHHDAVVIESFGVGGLPSYDSGDFYSSIEKWISQGKVIVMTTQVTQEGSNMSVYEVGQKIKNAFGLIESYDMTLEATVTKLMWILGQTREPDRIRELFYRTVNHDILWKTTG